MATSKNNSAKSTNKVSKATKLETSLSKDAVKALIDAGIIHQEYLRLDENFAATYAVTDYEETEVKSFKTPGEMVTMPKFTFNNDDSSVVVWGSTLLAGVVLPLDVDEIKTKAIKKAKGLPVYFRDEFNIEFPNLRKISDFRDEDGGLPWYNRYKIVGAITSRSKIETDRWSINYKLYNKGTQFLEFEKLATANSKLNWLSEERLHEIANLPIKDRTYTDATNKVVVLPGTDELVIIGNADTNVRWAKATFIFEQTW